MMGLLSFFGLGYKSPIGQKEKGLLASEKEATAKEKAKADALRLRQKEERAALKTRGASMRGGGRKGLMFGGTSDQGVA